MLMLRIGNAYNILLDIHNHIVHLLCIRYRAPSNAPPYPEFFLSTMNRVKAC